ncbi:hypothetical protein [Flavobacterium cerinum]|uniref:Uncharacterized protein n=1 Tax=Flavobacterium cerinum TaxID=2502784 RepID=A0ABY5IUR2_9FLAO|nr:hypothetical protein [Flavobacterium cerinum]UUC46554.1 hypothetical protein NOX80_04970 [Flavobacterium cerinum]
MNAEKESNPKNVAQKKDQKQAAVLPFSLRETENANSQTQDPDGAIKEASVEGKSPLTGSDNVPVVHGSDPAYSDGSEKMHRELQSSLEKTGGLDHPETKQAEKDYKSTLGISELRNYNDIKSGTYIPKNPEAKVAETTVSAPVTKNDGKIADKTVAPVETAVTPEAVGNQVAVDKTVEQQPPAEGKQDVAPAVQPKKQTTPSPAATSKGEAVKPAKETKQVKISNTGKPGDLLTDLSNTSATELARNFNAVQKASAGALNNQNKEAENSQPKLNEAQGSAFSDKAKNNKNKNNKNKNSSKSKTAKKTVKAAAPKKASKDIAFPEKEPLKKTTYSFQTGGDKKAPIDKQAKSQFDAVRLNTSGIPTRMKENANLELTGDASVEHLAIEQNDASHDVSSKKNHAEQDIQKDYGEHDIIKKPGNDILKSKHKFKSKNVKSKPVKGFKTEGFDAEMLNAHFDPEIQTKIGAEKSKYDAAEIEHDQKVFAEEKAAETKVENEKSKSKERQLKSVREAQGDVDKSRLEWQNELDKTESDFAKKSGEQAKTTMGKIQTEKTAGEAKAQGHINKANDDALKEKQKADRDAEKKKAEEEKSSGGFFGWVADKASAFINALKDALNVIFTKLRAAVKAIFDLAKKLMLEALEFARKAIVNIIKGFGALLKKFLDVALAAFPAIRDRLKAKIDQFVNAAEKYVNQAFDQFKKAVIAIMDFLASVVDALLDALQSFYDFILDGINFIVSGILKIMEGLYNLGVSAVMMPDNFMGQLSEEFLGMDVTKPLPFEKTGMPEGGGSASGSDSEYSELLGKNSYEEDDFHVDPVTSDLALSPEILAQLQNGDGEIHFGENNNTMDGFKESFGSSEQTETAPTQGGEGLDVPADPYAQADWFIKYQNSQAPMDTSQSSSGKEAATANSMPEEMKLVGPWTPGVRLYYLKEQMWAGIKKNWEDNKWKYIGIGAAIVIGITALAILTAGAIFALIPPALQIFAAIMMAVAIAKASGFFKTFMTDGWVGNFAAAAVALARAIVIILVELIFILLFDSAALFKVLKTAAKGGVKGVVNLTKTGIKSTLQAGKSAFVATGKGFVKQAGKVKFFVEGLGKGVAKGAKSLDELGEGLAKRFKFKGFKIVVKGFRFSLYGSINPWVLLANGEVKKVKNNQITGSSKVGSVVKVGGNDAIVVGSKGTIKDASKSGFVDDLIKGIDNSKQAGKVGDEVFESSKKVYDELLEASKDSKGVVGKNIEAVAAKISKKGGVPRNPNFRPDFFKFLESQGLKLSENAKKFIAVHHIVPNSLKGIEEIADFLSDMGHNIDEVINAIGLPRIDLDLLDEAIKALDDSIDVLKNTKHVDEVKETLKLADDVDINELKRIVKELESIKDASIHSVKTYHPGYNAMMSEDILKLATQFDELIEAGVSKAAAIEKYKPIFDKLFNSTIDDLLNGTIKL